MPFTRPNADAKPIRLRDDRKPANQARPRTKSNSLTPASTFAPSHRRLVCRAV